MRLQNLISMGLAVGLVAVCSRQKTEAEVAGGASPQKPEGGSSAEHRTSNGPTPTPSGGGEQGQAQDTLLFRVQFAGTTALLANTNAAYLTNFATLPETAALGTQIVAKVASLPGRLIGERAHAHTNVQHSTFNAQLPTLKEPTPSPSGGGELANGAHGVTRPTHGTALQPLFSELLQDGFTLELRGNANGVTTYAVAAKATARLAPKWEAAWRSAGSNTVTVQKTSEWLFAAGGKTPTATAAALAAIEKGSAGPGLEAGNVLEGELAATLIPGPIQRSVYGHFSKLKIAVTPADQTLKIRGTATYVQDLPKLGPPPVVPTNLVTEPAISFTMVREPGAWLEPNSVLRRFLPAPIPDAAFFWGGESSPYQLSMALPFPGRETFNTQFGPKLFDQLAPIAKFMDTGLVVLDTNRAGVQWQGVPFVGPQVMIKASGPTNFLVAEAFPPNDFPPGLTPALIDRVSNRTNLVLYDWEFTQLRIDTAIRVGQFVTFSSGHQQLTSQAPTLKWMQAAQTNLVSGGNTFTEITQTGVRELSLLRRAPLAFTSIEFYWLAHWLESANFPAANFLMPVPAADAGK